MDNTAPNYTTLCIHRWSRILELFIGHAVNTVFFVYGFDYVLYPFVIWKFGLIIGGALMGILSLMGCLLVLWFYNWSRRDWLGIEQLKQIRDFEGGAGWRRKLATVLKRGDVIALIVLSLYTDTLVTVLWMRQGQIRGMTRRDWKILFVSWLITSSYWALVCFGGVAAIQRIWKAFTQG